MAAVLLMLGSTISALSSDYCHTISIHFCLMTYYRILFVDASEFVLHRWQLLVHHLLTFMLNFDTTLPSILSCMYLLRVFSAS